jgi:hypothetical protein
MEGLLGLAKAIPPDSWLILSLIFSAIVIGLDSVVAGVVQRDAHWDEGDADAHTGSDGDRELMGG